MSYENYFDAQHVEIRFVPDSPGDRPDEIWFVSAPGTTEDEPPRRDEIERELLRQLVARFAQTKDRYPPPYELEARYSYVNWGASGASLSVALILGSAVASAVVADFWGQFRDWLAEHSGDKGDEITSAGSQAQARWRVEASYGVDADSLELVAEVRRLGDGSWEYTLDAPTGERFVVGLERVGRGLVTGKIRQEAAPRGGTE